MVTVFAAYAALFVVFAVALPVRQKTPSISFPLQFSAEITITVPLLSNEVPYPPKVQVKQVYYDYLNKRARADISEGYEAAKTYIRRYDHKDEYMVRKPPIGDCKRSYLGEKMPFPEFPEETKFLDVVDVQTTMCNCFVFTDGDVRVRMYMDKSNGAPVKLVEEFEENGLWNTMLQYDFANVVLGEPQPSLFELPEPHSRGSCDRHVAGFPYIHAFHYFVRF